jgi:hypothetical protein
MELPFTLLLLSLLALGPVNASERPNVMIIVCDEHGFQLGEKERRGKYSLWERATRVNLLWVAPGVTKPRTRDWLLTRSYDTAEPTTQHPQTQIKGIIQS